MAARPGTSAPPPALDQGTRAEWRQLRARLWTDAWSKAAYRLRRSAMSEHRRMLGTWHGNLPDDGRYLHPFMRLLRHQDRTPQPARLGRAEPSRGNGEGAGSAPRRDHERQP